MGDDLREQIARDFAPNIWPMLLERHRNRLRLRADTALALPAVQRLVEQAAEAARLRAAVERVDSVLILATDAQLRDAIRRALDGEGTDG